VWLVVEGATGLWLYGASVTRRPRVPGRAVHRVVGACSLAVGAIVGLTGALLSLEAAVAVASPPVSAAGLARLDFVAARTQTRGRLVALVAEAGHRVRLHERLPNGRRVATVVDRDTGEIVGARGESPRDPWDAVRGLHGGAFAGWPSRLVYAVVGLALPVLSITGFLISTRRRA